MTKEIVYSQDGSYDYMLRADGSVKDLGLPGPQRFTPDEPQRFTLEALEAMRFAFIHEY